MHLNWIFQIIFNYLMPLPISYFTPESIKLKVSASCKNLSSELLSLNYAPTDLKFSAIYFQQMSTECSFEKIGIILLPINFKRLYKLTFFGMFYIIDLENQNFANYRPEDSFSELIGENYKSIYAH